MPQTGAGANIGPELTGAGAKPKADILIDIIDPNRWVEANYRMRNVTTKHGENYSRRLDSQTATSVDILHTTGKKHTSQRTHIAEMNPSALSIMPRDSSNCRPPTSLRFWNTLRQAAAPRRSGEGKFQIQTQASHLYVPRPATAALPGPSTPPGVATYRR